MPKVFYSTMQWPDQSTYEAGDLGIRRPVKKNYNGRINLWVNHAPSFWRWAPWMSKDSPTRWIWLGSIKEFVWNLSNGGGV